LVDNKGYLLNVIHGKSSLPADYYLVLTLELIKGESGKVGEDRVFIGEPTQVLQCKNREHIYTSAFCKFK
jgi:hypothetical protein